MQIPATAFALRSAIFGQRLGLGLGRLAVAVGVAFPCARRLAREPERDIVLQRLRGQRDELHSRARQLRPLTSSEVLCSKRIGCALRREREDFRRHYFHHAREGSRDRFAGICVSHTADPFSNR